MLNLFEITNYYFKYSNYYSKGHRFSNNQSRMIHKY